MIPHLPYRFIEQLKALPFVEAIYLYGSRARGDHAERSDIDLAILCPTASREEWSQVMEIIESADTLLEIDCVRFDQISDNAFRERIEQQKYILYDGASMEDWELSFQKLEKAHARFAALLRRIDYHPGHEKELDYDLVDGAIQRFEFTFELAWKTLKKMLHRFEKIAVGTARQTFEKAYASQWIADEEVWVKMLDDRNMTSHTYDEDKAFAVFQHLLRYQSHIAALIAALHSIPQRYKSS